MIKYDRFVGLKIEKELYNVVSDLSKKAQRKLSDYIRLIIKDHVKKSNGSQ